MYYQNAYSKLQNSIIIFSFYSLIFLRFFVLVLLNMIGLDKNLLWTIYDIGTYFFSILLIWSERKNLNSFNIDLFSIILLILIKPLEPIILKFVFHSRLSTTLGNWGGNTICIMSLSFLILFIRYRKQFILSRNSYVIRNISFGILFGIITLLIISIPMSFQTTKMTIYESLSNLFNIGTPILIIYQFSYAAISEEPLFRGFIFGYLNIKKVKPFVNIFIQTLLFAFGHLYYFTTKPISFFIVVPVTAAILGFTAYKTKSISASMITHCLVNGLSLKIGNIVSSIIDFS